VQGGGADGGGAALPGVVSKKGLWVMGCGKLFQVADKSAQSQHGAALGFNAAGKTFTLGSGFKPTEAISSFINPTQGQTVCECKTFMSAVFYYAISQQLNTIQSGLFDLAFPGLTMTAETDETDETELRKFMTINDITDLEFVMKGYWFWIVNPE
jgi:hypothetical protein